MTFPTITADGQTAVTGGVTYTSILASKRWRRTGISATTAPGSITNEMIAPGAVEPNNVNLAVTLQTTPPASPAVGPTYLVTSPATGAWAGKENQLATWNGANWIFTPASEGMVAWDGVADQLLAYNGTTWVVANETIDASKLTIGTLADNRLPARLSTGGKVITDAHTIVEAGYYQSAPAAINTPEGGTSSAFWSYHYIPLGPSVGSLFAYRYDGDTTAATTQTWRADRNVNYGPWYQVGMSKAEIISLLTTSASGVSTSFNVLDRDLSAPPTSPGVGSTYIVKATGTGAWTGHDGQFASWNGTGWDFYPFSEGKIAWIADENILLGHDGATTVQFYPPTSVAATPAGNIVASMTATITFTGGGFAASGTPINFTIDTQTTHQCALSVIPGVVGGASPVLRMTFSTAQADAFAYKVDASVTTGSVSDTKTPTHIDLAISSAGTLTVRANATKLGA